MGRPKMLIVLTFVAWALPVVAADRSGHVDSAPFLALVSEDAATVEVSLQGALLRAMCGFDADLKALCGGLESIQALIVSDESPGNAEQITSLMKSTEARLLKDRWSPLVRINEKGSSVTVLALEQGEAIHGLVVLAVDESELVFANISGLLDLRAIAALGEKLDIPGLDNLED